MAKSKFNLQQRFKLGFVINFSFMLLELIVGVLTGALVLLADAVHNLTDSITMVISWLGDKMSKKPADKDHTLGHGRISVLAALINSTILLSTAILIFFEAYQRLINPEPVKGGIIAIVSVVGIFANGIVALLFRKYRKDLNVQAAYANMAFDMIFSVASMVTGILIILTGKNWIDPVISIGIGFGLLYVAFGILKQASNIFLEGVPKGVDIKLIRQTVNKHDGVKEISRLYAWSISSDDKVISLSIVPAHTSYEKIESTRKELKKSLNEMDFKVVIIETI